MLLYARLVSESGALDETRRRAKGSRRIKFMRMIVLLKRIRFREPQVGLEVCSSGEGVGNERSRSDQIVAITYQVDRDLDRRLLG